MTIVLDTNVLVSGALNPFGTPAAIIKLVIEGKITLAYDIRILTEYREVLMRPKFPFTSELVEALLELIIRPGIMVSAAPMACHLPDPDDEIFVEVALNSRAEALVTGNKEHFPPDRCRPVKILSPAEFLTDFRQLQQ